MALQEIVHQRQRLEQLFKLAGQFDDLEVQSHWANYLCVRVSGLVETSVRVVYTEYAVRCANVQVAAFVGEQLRRPGNLTMEKILQITARFDKGWRTWLEGQTSGELKAAVDSVVARRNSIAHGEAAGISLATVKGYYRATIQVIDLLQQQCGL